MRMESEASPPGPPGDQRGNSQATATQGSPGQDAGRFHLPISAVTGLLTIYVAPCPLTGLERKKPPKLNGLSTPGQTLIFSL